MANQTKRRIEPRLTAVYGKLQSLGPVMRGSVTVMGTRHKQPYFSVSIGGKTRLIYLGNERAKAALPCVANYRRLMRLVDEATRLQMRLLKAQGPGKPRASHRRQA